MIPCKDSRFTALSLASLALSIFLVSCGDDSQAPSGDPASIRPTPAPHTPQPATSTPAPPAATKTPTPTPAPTTPPAPPLSPTEAAAKLAAEAQKHAGGDGPALSMKETTEKLSETAKRPITEADVLTYITVNNAGKNARAAGADDAGVKLAREAAQKEAGLEGLFFQTIAARIDAVLLVLNFEGKMPTPEELKADVETVRPHYEAIKESKAPAK